MEKRKYTTNYNGWYMYMGDHRFNNKLGVHLEAQFRRHDIITQNQQLLLRTDSIIILHLQHLQPWDIVM
jgi:hypothetical protein